MAMEYGIESWIWYTLAIGIIAARLISRTLLFGSPRRLQYDDWLMGIFITTTYTVLIVISNLETKTQSNLLGPTFDITTLTPSQISSRIHSIKLIIIIEQMQIAVIWLCKTCLLILYHRLTRAAAPKTHIAVKFLAAYVTLGFLIMEILFFTTWCRPFHQYWSIPTRNSQCSVFTYHRITNAVFNISSDLIMLAIALSLSFRSLLPLKRKLVLYGVFGIGIFAIIAAVLNKYYSFEQPYQGTWVFWYTRESSTAVIVANLPFTWTLLRKTFKLGAFDEGYVAPVSFHSSRAARGRVHANGTVHAMGQHDRGTGTSGGSGRQHGSGHLGSKGSHSVSLTGPEDVSLEESSGVYSRDFASGMSDVDVHVERGRSCAETVSYGMSREKEGGDKLRPDGTGGYMPSSPPKAYLAPECRNGPSRACSIASTTERPVSPSSTQFGGHTYVRGAGGGGRSAADRRTRARISV